MISCSIKATFLIPTSCITNINLSHFYNFVNPFLKVSEQLYSKNNTITETNDDIEDPKPYLIIRYKNFNGLEDYMTYQTIDFQNGKGYVNNLTGNLTTVFHVNQTIGGKFPVNLNLIYNSNDAVLKKNIGLGLGYRWNFSQTIEEITIGEEPYLAYIDADGTTHYFYQSDEHTYQDEDGLNLTISKDNSTYVMTDAYKNKKIFEKKRILIIWLRWLILIKMKFI